jgi:ceramide glucosyltransferase
MPGTEWNRGLPMDWYYAIAWVAIVAQLLAVYYAVRNYRYVVAKSRRGKPAAYRPRITLIIPCKGSDPQFDANVQSFLEQDYDNYRLFFVVESDSDPAFAKLRTLTDRLAPHSRAGDIQIFIAGPSRSCGQKIHNLLCALDHVPDDTEVLAFADSDACVHRDWLGRLVRPLRRPAFGVATGYRWFVPTQTNLASLVLSALNAAVAQLLGNSILNHAWGGSMAIRLADFRRLNVAQLWSNGLSDDLLLSRMVKQAGLRIAFVPECLVASFESTTWPRLAEFARRQFLITRVYTPRAWALGLLFSLGSVAGLWGGSVAALYAAATHAEHLLLYAAVPVLFFAGHLLRAVLRQLAAARVLRDHLPQLGRAAVADVLGCWLWSPLLLALLLSSAFGRTIRWRGIRYKLLSPTRMVVLDAAEQGRRY